MVILILNTVVFQRHTFKVLHGGSRLWFLIQCSSDFLAKKEKKSSTFSLSLPSSPYLLTSKEEKKAGLGQDCDVLRSKCEVDWVRKCFFSRIKEDHLLFSSWCSSWGRTMLDSSYSKFILRLHLSSRKDLSHIKLEK